MSFLIHLRSSGPTNIVVPGSFGR